MTSYLNVIGLKGSRALLATAAILAIWLTAPLALAECLADADELLLKGDFAGAEKAYRKLSETDKTGDAHAGLAVALAKQKKPSAVLEAEAVLKEAKELAKDNPNVLAAGGYVSYVHSRTVASPAKKDLYLEAGEKLSRRALKLNPDILIAYQTLGLVRLAQDDLDEAVDPLRRAVALSESAANLTLLAQSLLRLNPKDPEAAGLVESALGKHPHYHPAILAKALLLANQGQQEEGFMLAGDIPESARNADWHLVRGDIYRKQGDGPAALAAWREAIRLSPHNPEPYKHLAEYYAIRGDGELAIAELHNALEILPNDMFLRNQLAELALRQDKLDVAETEYRTILASRPDDPGALLGLSRVYFRKARVDGQYPPGWRELSDRLQEVVTEESVKGRLIKKGATRLSEQIKLSEAEKALAQNRFKEARQHFAGVINQHRGDPYELLTLGEQAFADGDLYSAERAFTFAREIPEVTARAELGLSKIVSQRNEAHRQVKLGDATCSMPAVASDHYRQALIADPQSSSAYYGLYRVSTQKGNNDPQEAIKYALAFLDAAEESNPRRKEVTQELEKLRKFLARKKKQ